MQKGIRWSVLTLSLGVSTAVALATPALAVAPRTFVASSGNDANACTVAQPCRTFTRALVETSPGGEIVVLDSAGYGPVAISQSVSIVAAPGVYAGIRTTSGNGVTVNGAGITVELRGLTIMGTGTGYGIHFQSGAALRVENTVISKAGNRALHMEADGKLFVTDTIVRDGGGIGISAPSTSSATLTRVQVINASIAPEGGTVTLREVVVSNSGIRIIPWTSGVSVSVIVERSTISAHSGGSGIAISGFGSPASVSVTDSTISENAGDALAADTGATLIASGNKIVGNGGLGFYQASGAVFKSAGDNVLSDNNAGGPQTQGSITPIGKQ